MVTHSGTLFAFRSALVAEILAPLAALLVLLPALLGALPARLLRRHGFGHPGARLRPLLLLFETAHLALRSRRGAALLPLDLGLHLNLPGGLYGPLLDDGLAPA